MNHENGNDNGAIKQFITLVLGVVFRIVIDYIANFFKAKQKKQEVNDKPPENPGC